MEICIIGAGNIGTAIAADLGRKNEVRIYSSKPWKFGRHLTFKNDENGDEWTSQLKFATDSMEDAVRGSDIIFICVPTFMTASMINKMRPYLSEHTIVGFVPGAGGIEYAASQIRKDGVTVFGFERVPYIARLEEYGKSVCASKKPHYRVAVLPKNRTESVRAMIQDLFGVKCDSMKSFISLTLTPSLHTSRLYDLFRDYKVGDELEESPFFYRDWTDSASVLTFELDTELHSVCDKLTTIHIDASEVVPYRIHYESPTPEKLTQKLRSIHSLRNLKGPLEMTIHGKYVLDLKSRYFTESYPYRLCIVKDLSDILNIDVPLTDKVIRWYQTLSNKEYFVGGSFSGSDLKECNIPQNFGITDEEKLIAFYDALN